MAHPVSEFIVQNLYWVFLLFLGLNVYQRSHGEKARTKRFATLYLAMVVFVFVAGAYSLIYFKLPEWLLICLGGALVAASIALRARLFPFRFRCTSCGQLLTFKPFMFNDANLCDDCSAKQSEQATPS
jgi:hypothetical protein